MVLNRKPAREEEELKKKLKGDKEIRDNIKKARKNERAKKEIPIFSRILYEPILNDEKPKWLKITFSNDSIVENGKIFNIGEHLKEINIIDEGLWRCNKCGALTRGTDKPPLECNDCDFKTTNFVQVTDMINPDLWKLPKWEDIFVEDLDMPNTYNNLIELLKKTIVFIEEIQYKLFALWLISTWKLESWNAVGSPFFVGLVDSGKTKGLDIIRELGWRIIHATNTTFPAMVRATHYHNAGILLDEIEHKLNPKTERGQEMLDFVKPGYRKGSKYMVADKDNPKRIISYNNYGFKGYAGEILRDKGMLSRCIQFEMEKDYPEIEDITKIQVELDRIQTILLNYKYKTTNPPELPEDFSLHGRIREIFECIIRTGMHIGIDTSDIMEYAQSYEKEQIVEFQNSIEREILEIIYNFETSETLDDAPELIKLIDICNKLGWGDNKEKQRLGYILRGKTMGIQTFHTREGKVLKYINPKTRRKLNYLYKRYGVTSL